MGQCACPAAAGASDAQHAAAVFAAGYNLCRIYAGNAAYSAYRFHHDEACEYRKEFRTAAATVSAYAAVLCAVSLGYRAGSYGGGWQRPAAAGKSCSAGLFKRWASAEASRHGKDLFAVPVTSV